MSISICYFVEGFLNKRVSLKVAGQVTNFCRLRSVPVIYIWNSFVIMSFREKLPKGKNKKEAKSARGEEVPFNADRFRGDGVKFKCKLVGAIDVGSAEGDGMCVDAIKTLKLLAKLNKDNGEHKQRIVMYVTLNGIRIVDEKTQEVDHDHPLNKISYVTPDPEDKNIFAWVFSQPRHGYKLFAVKSEKPARVLTETMFELFQVRFAIPEPAGLNSSQVSNGKDLQGVRLHWQLDEKNQQEENSQRQLRQMSQQLTHFQGQLREKELQEAGLHEQLREKVHQQEMSQRQVREMEQQVAHCQEQLRVKEFQEANLFRQLREKEQQEENSQRQLREVQQQLARREQQLREKDLELGNSERVSREREQQLTDSQRRLWEKELQEASLREQLRGKSQEEENSQRQLREMEQQLTNLQGQLQDKELQETTLYRQLREKEQEEENSQRQLREIEQQLRERDEHGETLQRQLGEMEQQLTNLQGQLRQKEDESSNLQQQVTTLEGQLRAKDQEVDELEITLSTAQQALTEQQRQQTPDWVISRDQIQLTVKLLGRGGWGSVVEGKYCGCAVAVKQIHELILSAHNRSLFEREMDIASRCRHPCLLQFIGATNDEGSPLFVTELMESSLRSLLEQRPLSATEVSIISLDVARALSYLHHKTPPIIHRDISSANVLLWRQGDQWRGKVSDYGTANFMQQTMTVAPGAMIYSAPEAFTSNQTFKVDVYSFGVLLCEMCIRELPDPERRDQQIAMVTNRLLRALVRRCVQTEPETRPNMEEIIEELEEPA
ncbi:uncharacterized protein LOC144651439 isoform X2 [Oculina patagonica]